MRAAPAAPIADHEDRTVANLLWTLGQSKWLISGVALGVLALGLLYGFAATPTYRGDLVLQVEESRNGLMGMSDVASLLSDKAPPADTEIELIRSRSILGAVVDELGLTIRVRPSRIPILGGIAARRQLSSPAAPPFDLAFLSRFAWGGEHLRVQRLDVAPQLVGEELTLVAGPAASYRLLDPDGVLILTGVAGKTAAGGSGPSHVEMFVTDLAASPGTRFHVTKRDPLLVIQQLQKDLRVNEKGKKTGILAVGIDDPDPARAQAILDAIGAAYVRNNVEQKSASASKTLDFLETQLPSLRAELERAESARRTYQVKKGTVDLSREAQALLQQFVSVEAALQATQLQRSELAQRFVGNHPALLALASKIEKLKQERASLDARMRDLPGTEVDSARLTRNVKVANELYNVLLNKAQELRVAKSGTVGNVRIVDAASVPPRPVSPNMPLVVIASLLLGLTCGIAAAITRRALYTGIDDPETLERVVGTSVFAVVPRSAREASLARGRLDEPRLLSAIDPDDRAVESLRSLRTALQFSLVGAKSNVVVITGPTPGVGKTFISVNLGHVMAAAGRRVLVIDADLRRGTIHRYFGGGRGPGLSDLLSGRATLAEAVHEAAVPELHWLPTGRRPPNPSELLASARFSDVLQDLSSRFDVVIVDTAPILPVTDAALVGRYAASTLLVLGAGMHPASEIVASVKRLATNGVRVDGAVLNDIAGKGARYSRYKYEYGYYGPAKVLA